MLIPRLFDDPVRSIGDHRLPAGRQFFCRDQACEGAPFWRPGERIPVLAPDLDGHDDGDQKPLGDGSPEQVACLRLTWCKGPLRNFGSTPCWQRLTEEHRSIDELLHVAIDEHDVAAATQ